LLGVHLGWKSGSPDTILEGNHPRIIPQKFGCKKKIFSYETPEPISTKLCWNDPWVVPFQNCVWHFRTPTKLAATAELNLTLWEIPIKIFLSETICSIRTKFWWNSHWMILFQNWLSSFRGEDFFKFHPPFFLICIISQNRQKFRVHKKSCNIC
jgi:hypothetical protein